MCVTISHRKHGHYLYPNYYTFTISDLENDNKELQFEHDFSIEVFTSYEPETFHKPANNDFKFNWESLEFDFKNTPIEQQERARKWVEKHQDLIEDAFAHGKDFKVESRIAY